MRKNDKNTVAVGAAGLLISLVLCVGGLAGFLVPANSASALIAQGKSVSALVLPHSRVSAPEVQPPDAFEVNDLPEQAKGVTASPMVSLTFATAANQSPDDVDWYAISVDNNRILTITAILEGASTGLRVSAFLADGISLVGTRLSEGTNSTYLITNTTGAFQTYKFRVDNLLSTQDGRYRIEYVSSIFPQSIPSATPFGVGPDTFEDNDSPLNAVNRVGGIISFINIGSQIANANFYPNNTTTSPITATGVKGDNDWYFFYARRFSGFTGSGGTYRIATAPQPGVDTEIRLFRDEKCDVVTGYLLGQGSNMSLFPTLYGYSDDAPGLGRGSQIDFNSGEDCIYWIWVINKDPAPRSAGQTYSISVIETSATPGPTTSPVPTIAPTAFPQGIDSFEYNGDFDRATLIAAGVKYSNLNFVPFQPLSADTVDNDFFRMPVKQGVYYTCDSLDLAPGVDTNMIVFNQERAGIAGNDDISEEDRFAGRFNSRVTWLAGYTGFAYIVLGEVAPPQPFEAAARTYSLQCIIGLPITPTPIGGIPTPTSTSTPYISPTPEPPEPTMTPFPTPRSALNLPVRKVDRLPSNVQPPTIAPTATPRPITLDVQVFNDNNQNGGLDPSEGVRGVSVRIIDESSGTPLGQTNTDTEGRARFTIFNDGPVRVSVPLFGYSTLITSTEATVRIALMPMGQLPIRIP